MKRCSILLAAFVDLLSVAQAIPTDGLVALYNFEGNASDQSGNANNATAQGSFNYVAGRTGTGIRLNGDGSLFYAGGGYVALPQFSSALNDGFTLSLWAKDELIGGNPVGEEQYISFGVLDQPYVAMGLNNNFSNGDATLYWGMDMGAGAAYPIQKKVGNLSGYSPNWKNLVLTYKPGDLSGYLNGEKIGESNITWSGFPFDYAALGRHWWSGGSAARMSVTLDDVAIYSRALSDREVTQLYTGKVPDGCNVALLLGAAMVGLVAVRKRLPRDKPQS